MGNPLACSVANASIDLLLKNDWQTTIKRINTQLKDQLSGLDGHRSVKDVRCLGAVGVVEMFEKIDVGKIQKEFVSEGIWIRPFDKRIYLMPPYNISTEDLKKLTDGIIKVVKRLY
jgi:adenosylmethionine-8-amino-7-oxononanoate aminotransferase